MNHVFKKKTPGTILKSCEKKKNNVNKKKSKKYYMGKYNEWIML